MTSFVSEKLIVLPNVNLLTISVLILVDGTDFAKVRDAKATWAEWRFTDLSRPTSKIPIPSECGRDTDDLFDVISGMFGIPGTIFHCFLYRGAPTYGSIFPDFPLLMSLIRIQKHQTAVDDQLRFISFKDIQNPNKDTNGQLHSLRDKLYYIEDRIYELHQTRLHHRSDSDAASREWLDAFYNENFTETLASVSRNKQLLAETFQLLISSLSAADNERNLKQGRRSNLLTILAFVYVPLSFVTGIFGMNVKSVNGSPLPYWVCLITVAIVLTTTFLMWLGHFLWGQHVRRREDRQREREKMA